MAVKSEKRKIRRQRNFSVAGAVSVGVGSGGRCGRAAVGQQRGIFEDFVEMGYVSQWSGVCGLSRKDQWVDDRSY